MASIPLDSPEIKSPDMVSLIALVIATPGTNGIMEPIMTISILWPTPIFMNKYDKMLINTEARNLSIKNDSLNFAIKFKKYVTKKLIKKVAIESKIEPLNSKQEKLEAIAAKNDLMTRE